MAIHSKQSLDREQRVNRERVMRARDLIHLLAKVGVKIGWEGRDDTTFTPIDAVAKVPKLIQEATILTREIRAIVEGRIKFVTVDPKTGKKSS